MRTPGTTVCVAAYWTVAGLLALASPASAQHTGAGEQTFLTDVTGPAITSGDQVAPLFAEPGPVRTMDCPVAWGIRTAADLAFEQLQHTELRPVLTSGSSLGSQPQQSVQVLFAADHGESAAEPLYRALSPANNRQASRAARRLISESRGLLAVMRRIDPLRPGAEGATRLWRAVGAYNAFVDASSEAFLSNPPDELSALHAVLNALVIASLEHEDRVANPAVVDDKGLACAVRIPATTVIPPTPEAPSAPVAAMVQPPVERAIEICLYIDRNFRVVPGLYRPEFGDTLGLAAGERRPFSEVYPNANRFTRPDWLVLGDAVTVGRQQYVRFGVARSIQPGELRHQGQIDGVDYFVLEGEKDPPSVVYFPVASECAVQPYRASETIRVRG